jgi:hypothetical protein
MTRAFEKCFKCVDLNDAPIWHRNTFRREQTTGPERLVLAPAPSAVPVVRAMAAALDEPVYLLFVLRVSRRGREPGRYQSDLLTHEQLGEFLDEFGEFFDRDPRQHLWIGRPDSSALIVWDEHQIVYGYGPLAAFEEIASVCGLEPGDIEVQVPHAHYYHPHFDDTEDEILDRFTWQYFPLQEVDDP